MKFDRSKIHEALGDDAPHIDPTPLGRHRLVTALSMKFGDSWRGVPAAQRAKDHFESQYPTHEQMRKISYDTHKAKGGR